MAANWIVHRTLENLELMPLDRGPAPGPDHSIVVEAMAGFIQFAGAVPAMPTIWFDGTTEWLSDGSRLLRSLRLVGYGGDIPCIWRTHGREVPAEGTPFTAECAERTGSRARLIEFEHALDPAHEKILMRKWRVPGSRIGMNSYGWTEQTADALPDWLTWERELESLLVELPPLKAINGRRPPFREPDLSKVGSEV